MICICPNCQNVFEYAGHTNERKITTTQVYDIINLCCEHFEVTGDELFSKDRTDTVTKARHVAMYLVYGEEKNGITQNKVAEFFHRKDHSTVDHARTRCKDSLFTKRDVYKDLIILSRKAEEILQSNPLSKAS